MFIIAWHLRKSFMDNLAIKYTAEPPKRSPLSNSHLPVTVSFWCLKMQIYYTFNLHKVVTSLEQLISSDFPRVAVIERLLWTYLAIKLQGFNPHGRHFCHFYQLLRPVNSHVHKLFQKWFYSEKKEFTGLIFRVDPFWQRRLSLLVYPLSEEQHLQVVHEESHNLHL